MVKRGRSSDRAWAAITPLLPPNPRAARPAPASDDASWPTAFDYATYRRRNAIDRCVNKLKQWRGIAKGYEKGAIDYRAMVISAALVTRLVA